MKRNVLNSPGLLELKKRRQKVFLNKIFISLFLVLVIFLLLAYFSRLGGVNINKVEITGNKVLDTEALKQAVEDKIAGKYLWLFPKSNILIYPQNNIKDELQNEFKRIKDISLVIKNNKILSVSVNERVAKYTWCGIKAPDVGRSTSGAEQKCYFLDEDGYIFDEAPYFSGEVYFKFYGVTDVGRQEIGRPTSVNNPAGSYFSEQNFKQLVTFKEILTSIGLKPIALNILNNEDAEIILLNEALSTNEPKIIFKMNDNFQNVVENLQAALNTEPLKSKFKNKYSTLQYIDLRFENKVYDKFQ